MKEYYIRNTLDVFYIYINCELPQSSKKENQKTVAQLQIEKTAKELCLEIRWITSSHFERILIQPNMADLYNDYFVLDGVCEPKYWRTTDVLYKYMSLDKLANTLKNGVPASYLGKSNPFEIEGITNPKLYRKCCMTNSPRQMLLWAIYGNHKGCCVEYDVSSIDKIILRKVEYTVTHSSHANMTPDEICADLYKMGKEWDFENEYRAVFYKRNFNNSIWNVFGENVYLNAKVKSVTFGLYADDNTTLYRKCLELLKNNSIAVKKCRIRTDKYEIYEDPQFDLEQEMERIKEREKEMETNKTKKTRLADVLVMVATLEEEEAIRSVENWESKKTGDGYEYFITQNGNLTFALAKSIGMGGIKSASATQLFADHINPRFIAMAGFCAGKRGKVNLGDVFVPEKIYEYDSGKQLSETELLPDMESFKIDPLWIQKVERFGNEWRDSIKLERPISNESQMKKFIEIMREHDYKISAIDIQNCLELPNIVSIITNEQQKGLIILNRGVIIASEQGINQYENDYAMNYFNYKTPELKIQSGALATGNRVQQWDQIFDKLEKQYDRKTFALDMEGYAVADVGWIKHTPYIIAKGVGDFANGSKALDNRFIKYSSIAAFKFIVAFFNSLEGPELLER